MSGKIWSTLSIACRLVLARTFGEYQHSVWNGEFSYARYRWRGNDWAFPVSPIESGSEPSHDD